MAFDFPLLAIDAFPGKSGVDARTELCIVLLSESNEQSIVRCDAVVESEKYAAGIVLTRIVLDEVVYQTGPVRERNELQRGQGDRIEPACGDHVAWKSIANELSGAVGIGPGGIGIEHLNQLTPVGECLGEIAGPLEGRRNGGDDVIGRPLRNLFPVEEPERAVAAVVNARQKHRPSRRDSVFVAPEGAARETVAIVGPAVGVQLIVAKEFVKGPSKARESLSLSLASALANPLNCRRAQPLQCRFLRAQDSADTPDRS